MQADHTISARPHWLARALFVLAIILFLAVTVARLFIWPPPVESTLLNILTHHFTPILFIIPLTFILLNEVRRLHLSPTALTLVRPLNRAESLPLDQIAYCRISPQRLIIRLHNHRDYTISSYHFRPDDWLAFTTALRTRTTAPAS